MMRFITLSTILALSPSVSASVVVLTDDNFVTATAGKMAFVKFFAPWCGHCKAMASDWEQLAKDFENETGVLIAEVDCTADESEKICAEQDVEGFPTLKYGDAGWMDNYEGGREYDALAKFARTGLKPACSHVNTDLCTQDQKAKIEKFTAMPLEELKSMIDKIDKDLEAEEEDFDKSTDVLEEDYESASTAAETAKKVAKKEVSYNTLKAIQAARLSDAGNDEL